MLRISALFFGGDGRKMFFGGVGFEAFGFRAVEFVAGRSLPFLAAAPEVGSIPTPA
jgi:hypothetical protein